jgi:hypothetical protein
MILLVLILFWLIAGFFVAVNGVGTYILIKKEDSNIDEKYPNLVTMKNILIIISIIYVFLIILLSFIIFIEYIYGIFLLEETLINEPKKFFFFFKFLYFIVLIISIIHLHISLYYSKDEFYFWTIFSIIFYFIVSIISYMYLFEVQHFPLPQQPLPQQPLPQQPLHQQPLHQQPLPHIDEDVNSINEISNDEILSGDENDDEIFENQGNILYPDDRIIELTERIL